jgi:predicted Zn-dependent protease
MSGVEAMCLLIPLFLVGAGLVYGTFFGNAQANEESDALIAKKKWPEAVIVLRAIVTQNPHDTSAQVDLARALIYQGRREEALNAINTAIRTEKGTKRDWLIQQSRVFSKIFVSNETFQNYQDGLNLMMIQKYHQAREKFEKALAAESSNVEVLTRIGQSYLLDGDHDSAAEQLKLAHSLDPYEPEISLWLGRALHLRGELGEGIAELKAGYSEMKGSEIAPIWVADALEAAGQKAQALQVLEEDSKNYPLHVMSLVNAAKLKTQMSEHNSEVLWAARRDYQNALSRLSDYMAVDRLKSEGELGLDYPVDGKELREDIQSNLQKLQGKLDELQAPADQT